jgi:hypothetical protein
VAEILDILDVEFMRLGFGVENCSGHDKHPCARSEPILARARGERNRRGAYLQCNRADL